MSETDSADESRERRFLFGTIGGVLLLSGGFVALVLALSINVREPVTEIPMYVRTVGFYGGLAVLAAGYVARRWRWGPHVAAAGFVLFVLAGSTAVTPRSGAPYVSQADRWAIGLVALVLIGVGIRVVRRSARRVGWA